MKKLILISAMLLAFVSAQAEVIKLQATSFAYKYQNDYGYWTDWTDWEYCSILVVINIDAERINIYSKSPQEYDVINSYDSGRDRDGGETFTMECIDAEGIRSDVRLRTQRDGSLQLYVDYADMMWVYNVERK